ncbi:ABC-2 transporter permease [Clostridium sp.]|uniref:ABC-2 transporter permease n=1 Tax=Clostridium sp. TaxID=1506 RepID=UPI002FDEA345
MKGLILKDFMNLKQQWKVWAIFLIFYGFMSVSTKSNSMGAMIIVMCAILPTTFMSYDEKANWDKYALSMPLSRDDMVLSKYIISIFFFAAAFLLNIVLNLLMGSTEIEKMLFESTILSTVGILYISIILPILFKYGVEKSRLIVLMVFFAPWIIVVLFLKLNIDVPYKQIFNKPSLILPLISIVIFIISILISLNIYKKKEL